jgi:hypothetical protein
LPFGFVACATGFVHETTNESSTIPIKINTNCQLHELLPLRAVAAQLFWDLGARRHFLFTCFGCRKKVIPKARARCLSAKEEQLFYRTKGILNTSKKPGYKK